MSWIKYAKPGDKVVCVKFPHKLVDPHPEDTVPQYGHVYTIRSFDDPDCNGGIYIFLVEIVNPPRDYEDGFGEASFHSRGFRPVPKRDTDISIFHEILNKAPAKTLEEV